ncbi:hypothetical protein K7432_009217 [Basidiobolus ranarum]|uniref:Ribonuclease P protein subunit p20 n=1 Tax=Basidiobolus ranarum TaxID=34480 RepID=A0ABR2WQJ2_9FUNG
MSKPYTLHKRTPQRPATLNTDIYVSSKQSFGSQLQRIKVLLLEKRVSTVTIHGLGKALGKAILLATTLKEVLHDQVVLETTTSSVKLVDDIIPEDEEEDLKTNVRTNSAIHILVSMKKPE